LTDGSLAQITQLVLFLSSDESVAHRGRRSCVRVHFHAYSKPFLMSGIIGFWTFETMNGWWIFFQLMGILANGLFFVTLAVGFWVDRLGFPVGERNGGGALHRRGERVCTQHAQTETVIGHCRLTSGADRLGTEQRWQRRTN